MFTTKRLLLATILTASTAFSLITTGSRVSQAQDATAATTVTVDMNEYSFQVDNTAAATPLTLKVGAAYDLTIKNIGDFGHEIWFGRNVKKQDGRIDGYSDNLFTGVDMALTVQLTKNSNPLEVDTTAFYEVYLNPGEAVQLAFTLPATAVGSWELGCFQLLPVAKPAAGSDSSDNMGMTPGAGATVAAAPTTAATADASAAASQPSHYDVGMKLPVIVQ